MSEHIETTTIEPEEAMSELLGDLVVAYPKTVTSCHKEIMRLEKLLAVADEKIDALEDDVDDDEDDSEEESTDAEGAIHAFLDECERVGPLRYDVPQTDSAMRAIVALHDVVGRGA